MNRGKSLARDLGWAVATVLLAAGCGQDRWDSPEAVLAAVRTSLLAAEPDGRLVSLRAAADCESAVSTYRTETCSAADGRASIRQDYPQGLWFGAFVEGDGGGTIYDSDADTSQTIDGRWTSFVHGHEFHFAALAPDAHHENLRLERNVRFAGWDAVALVWIDGLGGENRSFYRRDDALPLGLELTNHMGGHPLITVRFSDWRSVEGNHLFWAATIINGANELRFRYRTIEVNPPLESLFDENRLQGREG